MWHVYPAGTSSSKGGERPNDYKSRQVLAECPRRASARSLIVLARDIFALSRYFALHAGVFSPAL